ncbi:MAG: hypothetical protein QUS33_14780 [Dehalococcoidia bacterium]|nr:hypothetical protein [Dehalococcoidia bacterium]
MQEIKVFFDEPSAFNLQRIRPLVGVRGLYFIFLSSVEIRYPFRTSRLIYIGMSEKKTNSIGNRLAGHYLGQSGNQGISNYMKLEPLLFTYVNFEMLRKMWKHRVEDLESYFILDFVKHYGVYPICNNKTGFDILEDESPDVTLEIDWSYFHGKNAGGGTHGQ